jgi:hypothetical protein
MPFTGSTYAIPAGTLAPAVVGTPVSAADWNAFITDLQTAMSDTLRATTQAFTGQVQFDPTAPAGSPAITFTGDMDTGIFQKGANEVGVAAGGSEILLATTTGVDVTGILTASGNVNVGGALDVTGNAVVDGTLLVTGAATLSSTLDVTGRITATAGVAGILVTDLPSRIFIDKSAPAPTAITGDTNWHELTPVSDAVTLTAANRVMLSVGPLPASGGTYATGTIHGNGNPSQALFRIARTVGPAYNVWTDCGAMEAWETTAALEQIPSFCFSIIDAPGTAGDYKYRAEGAVGAAGALMTITCIRLTGMVV